MAPLKPVRDVRELIAEYVRYFGPDYKSKTEIRVSFMTYAEILAARGIVYVDLNGLFGDSSERSPVIEA